MKIPSNIANGVPKKCPVCGKGYLMVMRTWKPTGRVSCEFLHYTGKNTCKKTYDSNL